MKKKSLIASIFLVVFLVGGFMIYRYSQNEEILLADVESAEDWTGKREISREASPTIEIPGFDSISLKAETKEQQVNFHNPKKILATSSFHYGRMQKRNYGNQSFWSRAKPFMI